MQRKPPLWTALALAASILWIGGEAQAATVETITLSDLSSEPATNPASDLDATFEFSVNDLGDELTLTVSNDTSAPAEYALNQIYFNFSSDVASIVGSSIPSGWTFATDDCPPGSVTTGVYPCNNMGGSDTAADGFGIFDASLKASEMMGAPDAIAAGDSLVFVFDLTGAGITASDFVGELSRDKNEGGAIFSFAAAKFIMGPEVYCPPPNDSMLCDSAYGAVPEPGGFGLVMLGLAGLALQARRRR